MGYINSLFDLLEAVFFTNKPVTSTPYSNRKILSLTPMTNRASFGDNLVFQRLPRDYIACHLGTILFSEEVSGTVKHGALPAFCATLVYTR